MLFSLRDKWDRKVKIRCVLVEKSPAAFAQLKAFTDSNSGLDIELYPVNGDFVDKIPDVTAILNKNATNTFKFVLLDPMGWVDIPLLDIRPIIEGRSNECWLAS